MQATVTLGLFLEKEENRNGNYVCCGNCV